MCATCRVLLFRIFVAVQATLHKFSVGADDLADPMHLQEPPTSSIVDGSSVVPVRNYVLRGMWGMLCANDACNVSRSLQEAREIN